MIPLLALGGLLLGGVVIATFWKEIVGWIQRAAAKVRERIGHIVYGVKIFVKKMSEAVKEISRHYSKSEAGQWNETIVTREVPESKIPKDISQLAKRSSGEVDISNELELQLS